MKIKADSPVVIEIAKLLGVPRESIGHFIIIADLPMGAMVAHTLPSDEDYMAAVREMARQTPIFLHDQEN